MFCFYHTDSPLTFSYPLNDKISFHSIVRVASMTTAERLILTSSFHTSLYRRPRGGAIMHPWGKQIDVQAPPFHQLLNLWTADGSYKCRADRPKDCLSACFSECDTFCCCELNSDSATWFACFTESWWSKFRRADLMYLHRDSSLFGHGLVHPDEGHVVVQVVDGALRRKGRERWKTQKRMKERDAE